MKNFLRFFALLLLAAPAAFAATPIVATDFETAAVPPGADLNKLTAAADNTRAHSGRASLRIASEPKAAWGYLAFELDGKLDFNANYEFSVWVCAQPGAKVSAYLSADDGSGDRYTSVNGVGAIKPGEWCELRGFMFADDWRKNHTDQRFIIRVNGTCWIDDLQFTPDPRKTPAQVWPALENALHAAADKRATPLTPGGTLTLDARNAALAPDTARAETALPAAATATIPAEGLLVFTIDATDDLELTGSIELTPGADLRPGLRATVLADDTVIAAPSVKATTPWQAVRDYPRGHRTILRTPPDIRGERPPSTVSLTPFRLAKGRHYITVAGPHMRDGGTFAKLELRAAARNAEKPLYTFGLLSDVHLSFNRREWRNTMSGAPSGAQLEAALRQLKREDASAFAIIAGDLADDGRRSQFKELAAIVKRAALPVYGCIGNHDTVLPDARASIAAAIPKLFPDGPKNTDYAFTRAPLRYIVLDGSHWRDSAGKITPAKPQKGNSQTTLRDGALDWLRKTLAADTTTPTVVISHYPFYFDRGVSPVNGYDRGKPSLDKNLMEIIDAAPNVVGAFCGHMHHNETATRKGITFLQNPAFAEWPNAYRVCRVYADRIEWEVRQMPNRGLIREEVIPETALLWQLSTDDGDLAGTIKLAPRASH